VRIICAPRLATRKGGDDVGARNLEWNGTEVIDIGGKGGLRRVTRKDVCRRGQGLRRPAESYSEWLGAQRRRRRISESQSRTTSHTIRKKVVREAQGNFSSRLRTYEKRRWHDLSSKPKKKGRRDDHAKKRFSPGKKGGRPLKN